MEYSLEKKENYVHVRLEEEKLDATQSPELKGLFTSLSQEGYKNFILNLANVKYADSSGLSAILVGNRLADANGGIFVLCELSEMVSKLIHISKLDTVLNQTPTLAEAVDAVFFDEIEKNLEEGSEEEDEN